MQLTQEQKIKFITQYVPKGESPKVYWELLKSQIMGTTKNGQERPDEDLYYFMYVAKRTGLDPMIKQIYPVYRWDYKTGKEKMTIQVGIDGMRLVAERTNKYAGSSDVVFDAEDQSHPNKATVTVYKMIGGQKVETVATARWTEYVQTDKEGKPMGLWGKMPYLMLGKCAEALALRKAFPNELSGIYTTEEMAQSETTGNVMDTLPKPQRVQEKDAAKEEKPAEEAPKKAGKETVAKAVGVEVKKGNVNETPKNVDITPPAEVQEASEQANDELAQAQPVKETLENLPEPVQQELPRVTDNIDLAAMRKQNQDNGK